MKKETFNILLVEDNHDDYDAIERAFKFCESDDINIEWIDSSKKAIIHFTELNIKKNVCLPDIIMLDLNMPGMGGREILKNTRKMQKLKVIPVIIFSTSDDQKDVKYCYEVGASSYIQKPVSFNILQTVCKRIEEYWLKTAILPK